MNHAQLFQNLVHELQVLATSCSEYDLIKSSKVLRQLLLDGDALLILVNRELRGSPVFGVRTFSPDNSTEWLNPEICCTSEHDSHANLTLQQFLAHQIGAFDDTPITVLQVIKYAAIILGGVHFKLDRTGEYSAISRFHTKRDKDCLSPALNALRQIGAIARDTLIPIRDLLLKRQKFEAGKGWTTLLALEILASPPDEDNYILDLGSSEHRNRFSIYVASRRELTFRIIDANGSRKYLRAGSLGEAVPIQQPIIIVCEFSSLEGETLLSLRTDGWDHAEIVNSLAYHEVGDPFHFVTGSDCLGRKHSHLFVYGQLLIARPLTQFELSQAVEYFATKAAEAGVGLRYEGNQFMYSTHHPNFPAHAGDLSPPSPPRG